MAFPLAVSQPFLEVSDLRYQFLVNQNVHLVKFLNLINISSIIHQQFTMYVRTRCGTAVVLSHLKLFKNGLIDYFRVRLLRFFTCLPFKPVLFELK